MGFFRNIISKFLKEYGKSIVVSYVRVPMAIIAILFLAYLVDLVIDLLPFTFPSSAVLMIILFLFKIVIHRLSPQKLSKWYHAFFGPGADWVLGNMGLFFTTSFILIPTRDKMPGKEIGLIFAVFPACFLISWVGTVGLCKMLDFLFPRREKAQHILPREEVSAEKDIKAGRVHSELIPPHAQNLPGNMERSSNLSDAEIPPEMRARTRDLDLQIEPNLTSNVSDPQENFASEGRKDESLAATPTPPLGAAVMMDNNDIERGESLEEFEKGKSAASAREDVIVKWMARSFDPMVYFLILVIGIPFFYSHEGHKRSLPLFLGTVSLAWMFSRRVVPVAWQIVLHPILTTSVITILVIWCFGAIKGMPLDDVLDHYSTGRTYLAVFRKDKGYTGRVPGSGDVMSTILVAGIVCLSFPLFRYRDDLFSNIYRILLVVISNCAIALTLFPYLACVMGIDGARAITFSARFLSTPFGIEFIRATGGDEQLVVVLICVTGILAVLIRDPLFKLLRVRMTIGSEDYFTVGMTIGVIAGAIGTSSLLKPHPRAAATATVSFVLYGLVLLSLVAISPVAIFVRKLSGY